jgi:hypothetical protein
MAPETVSCKVLPLPWQIEQFPSPGESQSAQVRVVMLHLPTVSAILIRFQAAVKLRSREVEGWPRALWVIAAISTITVIHRVVYTWPELRAGRVLPEAAISEMS